MNELKVFENPEFGQVRTVTIDSEVWFVGKDVAKSLGYKDSVNALKSHVDDEDKKGGWQITTPSGTQGMTIINESGVYSLILSSKLPTAKQFKRWVTNEVLPSIRKHGLYATEDTVEAILSDPDTAIRLLQNIKEERTKRQALEQQIQEDAPLVLFAKSVSTSKQSILIGELAKLLKQNGVDIGQNRLFEWMRQNGYLIRRKGTDYNMPTQRAMELGLCEIKETAITHADGHVSVSKTPKVTGKGQQYFVNLFLQDLTPIPTCATQ